MALKTGGELNGLAVMTLAGGERLGRVHDVAFQASSGRIVGFLVDGGGLLAKPKFLPIGAVKSVGTDALTVGDASAVTEAPAAEAGHEGLEARALSGRTVMNGAGTAMGTVKDVLVDTEALTVPAFVLATGFLDNALHGRPSLPMSLVQTVGKDSIVVSSAYDPKSPEHNAE